MALIHPQGRPPSHIPTTFTLDTFQGEVRIHGFFCFPSLKDI